MLVVLGGDVENLRSFLGGLARARAGERRASIQAMARTLLLHPLVLAGVLAAQKPETVQTPGIEWARDLDAALAASRADGRPVIAYFTFET